MGATQTTRRRPPGHIFPGIFVALKGRPATGITGCTGRGDSIVQDGATMVNSIGTFFRVNGCVTPPESTNRLFGSERFHFNGEDIRQLFLKTRSSIFVSTLPSTTRCPCGFTHLAGSGLCTSKIKYRLGDRS